MQRITNDDLKMVGFRVYPKVYQIFRNMLESNNDTARQVLNLCIYDYINSRTEHSHIQEINTDDSEFVSWTKYKRNKSLRSSA